MELRANNFSDAIMSYPDYIGQAFKEFVQGVIGAAKNSIPGRNTEYKINGSFGWGECFGITNCIISLLDGIERQGIQQ